MISLHNGTPRGDDYLARYSEAQADQQRYEQRVDLRGRYEPVVIRTEAELERLLDLADEASKETVRLGNELRCYISFRNTCERESLADSVRIAAQKMIDELMPLYEAAKVKHLAARTEYLGYVCGGTK